MEKIIKLTASHSVKIQGRTPLKYMLNKRDQIISNTQRFWVKTHRYGIRVTNTVKEAIDIDKENGDTLWWDAIMK